MKVTVKLSGEYLEYYQDQETSDFYDHRADYFKSDKPFPWIDHMREKIWFTEDTEKQVEQLLGISLPARTYLDK